MPFAVLLDDQGIVRHKGFVSFQRALDTFFLTKEELTAAEELDSDQVDDVVHSLADLSKTSGYFRRKKPEQWDTGPGYYPGEPMNADHVGRFLEAPTGPRG